MFAFMVPAEMSGERVGTKRRGMGQKISFYMALLSYLGAVASVVSFFYFRGELGGDDPVVASLGSTTVFFIGVGIVLHVIGRVDLPSLSLNGDGSGGKADDDER
jgi:hypothetical protein